MRAAHSLALTILVVAVASAGRIPTSDDANDKEPQDRHHVLGPNSKPDHEHQKQPDKGHSGGKFPPGFKEHPKRPHFRPTPAPDSGEIIGSTTQSESEDIAVTTDIPSSTERESESEIATTESTSEEDSAVSTTEDSSSTKPESDNETTTAEPESEQDSETTLTEVSSTAKIDSESEVTTVGSETDGSATTQTATSSTASSETKSDSHTSVISTSTTDSEEASISGETVVSTTESQTAEGTSGTQVSEISRSAAAESTATTKSWWQKLLFWQ